MNMKNVFAISTTSLMLTACMVHEPWLVQTTPTPAVHIHLDPSRSNPEKIHVCTLKAFTEEYRSEQKYQGLAQLDVQRQCTAQFDAMFCKEKDIICKTYE